jgi:Domain of unknown function (DUF4331)
MSHHYSGPDFGFPHGDARLDLTDLYAFPKPGEADKSILIMNVHPSAVVNPPGPTTREPFAPAALYELKIDTNGDAVADIAYRVHFSSSADGSQTATLRRVEGAQAAETGDSGQVMIEAAPVSTGRDARVTEAGRYRFFAGWRSDPFFFDTRGALNDLQFTGDDFFIDKDVCGIVLEMPNSALHPNESAYGRARWTARAGFGSRRTGARYPRKRSFSSARSEMATTRASRRTMPVSSPSSRMRWSTPVAMRRRKQGGWRERCCPTCCPTTRRVPRLFRAMAVRSPTMPPTPSWQSSQTGR